MGKSKFWQKAASVLTSIIIVLNSLIGVLLFPGEVLAADTIIADTTATYVGTWNETLPAGYSGSTSRYPTDPVAGASSATWPFSSITPGYYKVYVSWSARDNRTTSAQYSLTHVGGTQLFTVNQSSLADGTDVSGSSTPQWSGWYLLGRFNLNISSNLVLPSVDNSSGSDYVIADEVKLVPDDPPTIPGIVFPAPEQYFNTSPILNDWDDATASSGIREYRVEYQYDDGHTFPDAPYRITTESQRNHSPAISEQGGVQFRVQAFDNSGNEGGWSEWRHYYYDATSPTIPTITTPSNNSFLTTGNLPKIDWGDSSDLSPVLYQYQAFSDPAYSTNVHGPTAWFSGSEIPTPGTPEGTYYVRVRAKDAAGNESAWSNGVDNPFKITVDNTSPTIPGQIGWTSENPPVGSDYVGGDDFTNYRTCGESLNYSPMTNLWAPSADSNGIITYEREVYNAIDALTPIYSSPTSNNYVNGGGAVDGQTYWVRIRAVDAAGNQSVWTEKCPVTYDTTPPLSNLSVLPQYHNSLPISISYTASDNVNLERVRLYKRLFGSFDWDYHTYDPATGTSDIGDFNVATLGEGRWEFASMAVDAADNEEALSSEADTWTIYDFTPPSASWVTPLLGETLVGTASLEVDASDSLSLVKEVKFQYIKDGDLDFTNIETDTISPYSVNWDSTAVPLGAYTLRATVTDNANNSKIIERPVYIGPVISNINQMGISDTEVRITWVTDRPTSSRVVYDTTSQTFEPLDPNYGYGSSTGESDTSPMVTDHTVVISGLGVGTQYFFRVVAKDIAVAISSEYTTSTLSHAGPPSGGDTFPALTSSVLGASTSASAPRYSSEDLGVVIEVDEDVLGSDTEVTKESPTPEAGSEGDINAQGSVLGTGLDWPTAIGIGSGALLLLLILWLLFFRRKNGNQEDR